jgi:hypothetical protein
MPAKAERKREMQDQSAKLPLYETTQARDANLRNEARNACKSRAKARNARSER